MFKGVDHIAYLVGDMDAEIKRQEQSFGGVLQKRWVSEGSGSECAFIKTGNVSIELIKPGARSGRGPVQGWVLDHICYEVEDLDKALAEFAARGLRPANPPSKGVMGGRVVMLDAQTTGGARVQMRQW